MNLDFVLVHQKQKKKPSVREELLTSPLIEIIVLETDMNIIRRAAALFIFFFFSLCRDTAVCLSRAVFASLQVDI